MKRKVPKDHTTPMLVAVLSIFLITELPQGVMNVLTGIFTGDTFHQKVSNLFLANFKLNIKVEQ